MMDSKIKNLKLEELSFKEQKNTQGGLYPLTRFVLEAVGAIAAAAGNLSKNMGTGSKNDFYYSGSPKY